MSNVDGIGALNRRLDALGDTRHFLGLVQLRAVAEAKALVPRKTAFLARSIHPGSLTDREALVIAGAPYAAFVELGTRPHVILPKRKRVLAWPTRGSDRRLSGRARSTVKGGFTFAGKVNHPGTKAHPYLLPGAKRAIGAAGADAFIKAWNEAA